MRKQRSLIKSPGKLGLFMVVNVAMLFFLIIAFGREYVGNLQIEREIASLEAERERLESQQLDTLDLINELSSEYALEREARTKFGMGEQGETLIVVQDAPITEFDAPASEEPIPVGNPVRWFYYFFDKESFEELKVL